MNDTPKAEPPTPATSPAVLGFRVWMATQPWWVHLIVMAILMVAGGVAKHYVGTPSAPAQQPAPLTINLSQPAPTDLAPRVVGATILPIERGERLHVGHRAFAHTMRHRVSERLQKDGWALIGGDPTPIPREKAEVMVRNLHDVLVVASVEDYRVQQGDSPFVVTGPLDWFRSILAWLQAHPEFVKLLMALLFMLLGL